MLSVTSRKRHTLVDQNIGFISRRHYSHLTDPLEAAGRKKGPPRTLLFGTHCQELCASAKGTSEYGGYASMTEFPECILRKDSESVGTGKTHDLSGVRALRKCSEKRCHSANNVLFNH